MKIRNVQSQSHITRNWQKAPPSELAGFCGDQAIGKFSTGLVSTKTSWLARGRFLPFPCYMWLTLDVSYFHLLGSNSGFKQVLFFSYQVLLLLPIQQLWIKISIIQRPGHHCLLVLAIKWRRAMRKFSIEQDLHYSGSIHSSRVFSPCYCLLYSKNSDTSTRLSNEYNVNNH